MQHFQQFFKRSDLAFLQVERAVRADLEGEAAAGAPSEVLRLGLTVARPRELLRTEQSAARSVFSAVWLGVESVSGGLAWVRVLLRRRHLNGQLR